MPEETVLRERPYGDRECGSSMGTVLPEETVMKEKPYADREYGQRTQP